MAKSTNHLKAIVFDYGEVLCHRPSPEQTAALASFFGISVRKLPELWEKNRGSFDRGDLTAAAYWSMLAEDAGTRIDTQMLEEICSLDLAMWSDVNPVMVEWAGRIRSHGLKIALLSNMHLDMVAHCRRNFSWLEKFDFLTFSGEVNLIKPIPPFITTLFGDLASLPQKHSSWMTARQMLKLRRNSVFRRFNFNR